MSTSGEEHATRDSEASDKERDVYVAGRDQVIGHIHDDDYVDVDILWPRVKIDVSKLYEHLSPESANRILSMVEREQDYEKQARRTASWLTIFKWTAAAAALIIALVGLLLLGLNSNSSIPQIITSFIAGAGAIYALVILRESREPRITFRHRDDETSDDSHQDVR
jgi:uncharacterized membrane protein